ncbi:MAG: HD domain-containing protein [Armatimonadota bacterium]|nr:HD domain-containing protein [Armatimonadota bacterium]
MQAHRPGDILIVDSNQEFRSNVWSALTWGRHMLVSCATAAEARRHLEQSPFDVVLCAQRLPDGDGADLCSFIKTNPDLSHISVALLLDAPDAGGALRATSGGATSGAPLSALRREEGKAAPDDVIVKPVRDEDLITRVQNLLRMSRYLAEIQNAIGTIMQISEGVEEQDKRNVGHCKRLAIMAIELGAVMGCDEWQLTALERAGYLHDVGMVRIPGAVVAKAQPLSPREMEIIQTHTVYGAELCRNVAALRPVLPIIRHHHERADGTGYPDGLLGDQIPWLAQIFAIAHLYEALRSWRPYRPPMQEPQAVDIMHSEVARGFWNAKVFDAFLLHVLPGLDDRLDSMHVLWPRG